MHDKSKNGGAAILSSIMRAAKRRFLSVLVLTGVALVPPAVGFTATPITIGGSLGLTGRFAPFGDALRKGFSLWEQNVNEHGGMLGRPVKIRIEDDQSEPEIAQAIYRGLMEEKQVDFLFAPYSSLITQAVLPIAEKSNMPMLIAGAAADSLWEQGYRNAIGIYTPASKFTIGFLELLVRKGLDNIALLYANDPFSIDLAESTQTWARRFGLSISHLAMFEKGTPDLAPVISRAREKDIQVMMVCGHMEEAVKMVRALKQVQWRPKAVYASVGPALQEFYDRCGADAQSIFATSLWEPRANYPGAQEFKRQFIETYGVSPGYHAGLAYAAGQVLEKAVTEAGTIDRHRVRETLYHMDTMTIIGRFGVDKTGKQVRQHTFIIQWQNGRKELVWPDQIKTAEPLFE